MQRIVFSTIKSTPCVIIKEIKALIFGPISTKPQQKQLLQECKLINYNLLNIQSITDDNEPLAARDYRALKTKGLLENECIESQAIVAALKVRHVWTVL